MSMQNAACSSIPEFTWLQFVREVYPNLHGEVYFFPPLHFNRVPRHILPVAGEQVIVYEQPPATESHSSPRSQQRQRKRKAKRQRKCHPYHPPVSGVLFPRFSEDSQPTNLTVHDNEIQDDEAQGKVLHCLRTLAEETRQVMMVISQLEFRKYLDTSGLSKAEARVVGLLPSHDKHYRGECDILIIHHTHGLVIGEVKSVGGNEYFKSSNEEEQNRMIVQQVDKAVNQLHKQRNDLHNLVSDLGVKVTKSVILPNITSGQLIRAFQTDSTLTQVLCQCMETDSLADAVSRCLCADQLPDASHWWHQLLLHKEPDSGMNDTVYERLLARFCGPATAVDIPTVTVPRKVVRTRGEAVSEAGLTVASLALYPQQVEILSTPDHCSVFLWGPPGTGKTILLYLRAKQWINQGHDVQLVSIGRWSQSVTILLQHQLTTSLSAVTNHMRKMNTENDGSESISKETSTTVTKETSTTNYLPPKTEVVIAASSSDHTASSPCHGSEVTCERSKQRPTTTSNDQSRYTATVSTNQDVSATETTTTRCEERCDEGSSTNQSIGSLGTVHRHHLDLESGAGTEQQLTSVVDKLVGLSDNGRRRLYIVVDEVDLTTREQFLELCSGVYERLNGQVSVWAAGLYKPEPAVPDWMETETLTHPLRSPPVVQREVGRSKDIGGSDVPQYSVPPVTPATEGPPVRWLRHKGQPGHEDPTMDTEDPERKWGDPRDCTLCGQNLYAILKELRVEEKGSNLHWKDVLILSGSATPSKTGALMKALKENGVPITVIKDGSNEDVVISTTLAQKNQVLGAGYRTISGLERRVVVGMGWAEGMDRLRAISRCTSQLIWIDQPRDV